MDHELPGVDSSVTLPRPAPLLPEPLEQVGTRVGPIPAVVADTREFRIDRPAPRLAEGADHLPREARGDHPVVTPLEAPARDAGEARDGLRVASPAEGDDRRPS